MFEPSQILGFVAATLLLLTAVLWLRPSTLQPVRTSKRAAPPSRELSQSTGSVLLLALGASALAAVLAVVALAFG